PLLLPFLLALVSWSAAQAQLVGVALRLEGIEAGAVQLGVDLTAGTGLALGVDATLSQLVGGLGNVEIRGRGDLGLAGPVAGEALLAVGALGQVGAQGVRLGLVVQGGAPLALRPGLGQGSDLELFPPVRPGFRLDTTPLLFELAPTVSLLAGFSQVQSRVSVFSVDASLGIANGVAFRFAGSFAPLGPASRGDLQFGTTHLLSSIGPSRQLHTIEARFRPPASQGAPRLELLVRGGFRRDGSQSRLGADLGALLTCTGRNALGEGRSLEGQVRFLWRTLTALDHNGDGLGESSDLVLRLDLSAQLLPQIALDLTLAWEAFPVAPGNAFTVQVTARLNLAD
ncbi:MAG: hypothetical protein HY335_08495, partial [Deinococcus sp.]|nr:hypothetical protein [Deinococcus sp.]